MDGCRLRCTRPSNRNRVRSEVSRCGKGEDIRAVDEGFRPFLLVQLEEVRSSSWLAAGIGSVFRRGLRQVNHLPHWRCKAMGKFFNQKYDERDKAFGVLATSRFNRNSR